MTPYKQTSTSPPLNKFLAFYASVSLPLKAVCYYFKNSTSEVKRARQEIKSYFVSCPLNPMLSHPKKNIYRHRAYEWKASEWLPILGLTPKYSCLSYRLISTSHFPYNITLLLTLTNRGAHKWEGNCLSLDFKI